MNRQRYRYQPRSRQQEPREPREPSSAVTVLWVFAVAIIATVLIKLNAYFRPFE